MFLKVATLGFLLMGVGGDYRIMHVEPGPAPDAVKVGEVFDIKIKYSSLAILNNWKVKVICDGNLVCLSPMPMAISAPKPSESGSLDLRFKGTKSGISECTIVVSAEDNINGAVVAYDAAANFSINVQQ